MNPATALLVVALANPTAQQVDDTARECLQRVATGYAYLSSDLQPQDIADAAVSECETQVRALFVPVWEAQGKPTGPGVADRLWADIQGRARQIALASAVKAKAAFDYLHRKR